MCVLIILAFLTQCKSILPKPTGSSADWNRSFLSFNCHAFKKNGVQEPITRTPPTRQPKSAPPTHVVFTSVAACRNQLPNTSSPPGPGSKTAWQMLNIIQALPIHAEIGGQKAQLFQIFFGEGLSLPQRACAPTHSEAVLSRNPKSVLKKCRRP